ncbi:MAG: hypothetical protein AAF810_10595 [Cyanobacteria bacterium P01_D01_bin.36]
MSSQTLCLEVAVSTAKEPAAFEPLQKQTHQALMTLPRFVQGIPLRGLDDPASRADLILWDSATAAKSAAAVIQNDVRFSSFMEGIESVRHFAHYDGASSAAMHHLTERAIIEIAAYEAAPNSKVSQLRPAIHKALSELKGASPQIAGTCIDKQSALIDVVGWDAKATHQAAPALLIEHHPELKSFFSDMGKVNIFELFEVVV